MRKLKQRLALVGAAVLCVAGLAVLPKKARPAVPARPVEQGQGTLSGRVILVDAGHGGEDGGARAKDSGVWEKEIHLRVARLLRDALEQSGAKVILTRETDMEYDRNKRSDLTARLELAKDGNAEMLLCIHMNEYPSRRESGPQVFYRAGQENSRLLAGALQAAKIRALKPAKERSAMAGDYFMLSLDIPSVLVECGFLSNAAEEKLLLTPAYQESVAQSIRDGVIEYFALTAPREAQE